MGASCEKSSKIDCLTFLNSKIKYPVFSVKSFQVVEKDEEKENYIEISELNRLCECFFEERKELNRKNQVNIFLNSVKEEKYNFTNVEKFLPSDFENFEGEIFSLDDEAVYFIFEKIDNKYFNECLIKYNCIKTLKKIFFANKYDKYLMSQVILNLDIFDFPYFFEDENLVLDFYHCFRVLLKQGSLKGKNFCFIHVQVKLEYFFKEDQQIRKNFKEYFIKDLFNSLGNVNNNVFSAIEIFNSIFSSYLEEIQNFDEDDYFFVALLSWITSFSSLEKAIEFYIYISTYDVNKYLKNLFLKNNYDKESSMDIFLKTIEIL